MTIPMAIYNMIVYGHMYYHSRAKLLMCRTPAQVQNLFMRVDSSFEVFLAYAYQKSTI